MQNDTGAAHLPPLADEPTFVSDFGFALKLACVRNDILAAVEPFTAMARAMARNSGLLSTHEIDDFGQDMAVTLLMSGRFWRSHGQFDMPYLIGHIKFSILQTCHQRKRRKILERKYLEKKAVEMSRSSRKKDRSFCDWVAGGMQ